MSRLRCSFLEILPSEHRKRDVLTSSKGNRSEEYTREIFKERKHAWEKLSDESTYQKVYVN